MKDEDPYWSGLLEITSMYRSQKEVTRSLIESSKVVVSILTTVYYFLVSRQEIDPCESTDKKEIAYYLIEII